MGKHETIVPLTPPAARAPFVLGKRPAIERELADLKQHIAETALAAYEGKANSRENLTSLAANIAAVTLQLESNGAAHELAQRLDREARAAWRADIEAADPKKMVAGITKDDCCGMCSDEHGCIITGLECGHPVKVGGVGPRLMSNPQVRALYQAAVSKLGIYR